MFFHWVEIWKQGAMPVTSLPEIAEMQVASNQPYQ
jgi:hypothetical protein